MALVDISPVAAVKKAQAGAARQGGLRPRRAAAFSSPVSPHSSKFTVERKSSMKAIVTVIGRDKVGITAAVCALLAQHSINILDISQTVLQEYFTMVMLVDLSACTASIGEMSDLLEQAGREQGLSIRIQREDIFNAMHRI